MAEALGGVKPDDSVHNDTMDAVAGLLSHSKCRSRLAVLTRWGLRFDNISENNAIRLLNAFDSGEVVDILCAAGFTAWHVFSFGQIDLMVRRGQFAALHAWRLNSAPVLDHLLEIEEYRQYVTPWTPRGHKRLPVEMKAVFKTLITDCP